MPNKENIFVYNLFKIINIICIVFNQARKTNKMKCNKLISMEYLVHIYKKTTAYSFIIQIVVESK